MTLFIKRMYSEPDLVIVRIDEFTLYIHGVFFGLCFMHGIEYMYMYMHTGFKRYFLAVF